VSVHGNHQKLRALAFRERELSTSVSGTAKVKKAHPFGKRARVEQKQPDRLLAAQGVERLEADGSDAPASSWCTGTDAPFPPPELPLGTWKRESDALNILGLEAPTLWAGWKHVPWRAQL
jgi:hypothetical protein